MQDLVHISLLIFTDIVTICQDIGDQTVVIIDIDVKKLFLLFLLGTVACVEETPMTTLPNSGPLPEPPSPDAIIVRSDYKSYHIQHDVYVRHFR